MGAKFGGDGFLTRRVRLTDLRPRWLTEEGTTRFQMGVSILCPGHLGLDHRLDLWFLNPCDGGPPTPHPTLHYRLPRTCTLEDLTITGGTTPSGKSPIAELIWIEGHFAGYIYDGMVIDSLRVG